MSDYAKVAKDKDVQALLQSMTVDIENLDIKDVAAKHNLITDHAITWLALLRQRHHDFDGLLHSVEAMVKILNNSHEDLKKEQVLLRGSTDANTVAITKLVTVGETSLSWLKWFLSVGGISFLVGIVIGIIKILAG